jgi:Holliday junction resolvase
MQTWKKFEYRVRDFLLSRGYRASRVPLSGSAKAIKGDVIAEKGSLRLRIDAKSTRSKEGIRISRAALEKLSREAARGEVPILVFSFYRHAKLYAVVSEALLSSWIKLREKPTRARSSVGIAKEEVLQVARSGEALLIRFRGDSEGYVVVELPLLLKILEGGR